MSLVNILLRLHVLRGVFTQGGRGRSCRQSDVSQSVGIFYFQDVRQLDVLVVHLYFMQILTSFVNGFDDGLQFLLDESGISLRPE